MPSEKMTPPRKLGVVLMWLEACNLFAGFRILPTYERTS
jgi:hypothetical protein